MGFLVMVVDDNVTCSIKECNIAFSVVQVLKRTAGCQIWSFLTKRGMFEMCVVCGVDPHQETLDVWCEI